MTVSDAAHEAGVTTHQVRAALRDGTLQAQHAFGREPVLDDIAVIAWKRSRSRGRRWSQRASQAALDLLSTGTTMHFTGSELSRLRRVLRTATPHHLAYLAGGLGGTWARYRGLETVTGLVPIGPSAVSDIIRFDTVGPREMSFVEVDDLNEFETRALVAPDGEGDLGVVERRPDRRVARVLLDTYLLGDSRESTAAAQALMERARDL
ncbi:hypothetical protein [Tessaracoccus lapidicaptus]|uniref:hypothetical protein n=1 Tax=Tessaracoccus lapidicaptus TaxID=1427523 RepID=UPI0011479B5C|nr:hypothetical protein [Tessaracoccus lapidicaptus]